MTDTDLRALFEAWLRDRGQVHKLANLSSAVLRAYTEAVTQAAVRTAYPPQVRASVSPAIGNPACVPPDADGERQRQCCAPAIAHADGSPLRADRLPPEVLVAEVSLTRDVRETWERGPVVPRRTEDRA